MKLLTASDIEEIFVNTLALVHSLRELCVDDLSVCSMALTRLKIDLLQLLSLLLVAQPLLLELEFLVSHLNLKFVLKSFEFLNAFFENLDLVLHLINVSLLCHYDFVLFQNLGMQGRIFSMQVLLLLGAYP